MPRQSYKPEEIVAKLRQVDVLISRGQSVAEAIRSNRPYWTSNRPSCNGPPAVMLTGTPAHLNLYGLAINAFSAT